MAPLASPTLLPTKASLAPSPSFSVALMVSVWISASLPTSHSTGSAAMAVRAYQYVSAITATALPSIARTFFTRSEEHTSELQSLRHLVCRLLLDNKYTELFATSLEK